jgi:pimeloyl-ACP methyl ester carboxylesterase
MAALERGFRDMVVRKDREVFSDDDLREIKRSFEPAGAATAAINYYRAQFRNRAALTRYSLETRIACPTLLIWAEDDVALGKELTVGTDALVDGPFSIRFIPDCSHWVQQERPEEVNEALLSFLTS